MHDKIDPRGRGALGALLALMVSVGATSCAEPFDPYWRIEKLRVMALKADPPTLRPFRSAQLEVLLYQPPPERELAYQWEWCPFQTSFENRFECPLTRDELLEQLEASIPEDAELPPGFDLGVLLPEFDLGTEPTAELAYPGTPELVLGLCQGLQGVVSAEDLTDQVSTTTNCERGFEVTVRVTITAEGLDEPIVAARKVRLWTGSEFDQNQNPEVADIEIRLTTIEDIDKVRDELPWVEEAAEAEGRWHPLSEGGAPTPIVSGVGYDVRSRMDPESIERWQPPAPAGTDRERDPLESETLAYRWFVTAGSLGDSTRVWNEELNDLDESSVSEFNVDYDPNPDPDAPGQMLEDGQETDWDLDGVDNGSDNCPQVANPDQGDADDDGLGDACRVTIWSVVRDGRLGLDWHEAQVELIGHVE